MINSIDVTIIHAMARTLFCMAWADWIEQVGQQHFPPGTKIEDVAPPTPKEVLHLAYFLAGQVVATDDTHRAIKQMPPRHSLMFIFRDALLADGKSWAGVDEHDPLCCEFGSDLAMMIAGTGVSWFDDHAEFAFRWPDVEWTHIHLAKLCGFDYPAPNGKWQLLWSSGSDGYWFLSPEGRITKADHSIDRMHGEVGTPDHADDGPIYVDMSKQPTIRETVKWREYIFEAFRKDGSRCVFGARENAAHWIFTKFPFMRPTTAKARV